MRTLKRIAFPAGLIALAACYGPPEGAVYIQSRPPAYQEEAVGIAPGPGYLWIRGYWEWGGAQYNWVPGRWAMRPHPRAVWVPGGWHSARRGWYFRPGHWR
jgi:hypothetical protein